MRILAATAALFFILVMPPGVVYAQTETAKISGTLTDTQERVVVGVTVTARSASTNTTRTTVTDADGRYVIANLLPATYEVSFQLTGFKTMTRTLRLAVGSNVGADAALDVGGVSEAVSVVAPQQSLSSRTAEVATTISEREVRWLPTLTRNPYDLVKLAGTVSDQDLSGAGTGYAINGLRAASTNVLLDGAANNDEYTGSVGQTVPLDTVQELSVITGTFSAQYGRATAGIVNVVTRAGTNDYHGSLYDFARDQRLVSQTVDEKAHDLPKSTFTRSEPGFSLGGPIAKNRAQFFVSGEMLRVRSSTTTLAWVPTPELLAATAPATQEFFSKFPLVVPASGPVIRRADVPSNAGGPFASLPADMPVFSQVERSVPIDGGGGTPQDTQEFVGRTDWNAGNHAHAYARYALQHEIDEAGSLYNSPYQGFDTGQRLANHNALFSLTQAWRWNFTSQSKVVFNRLRMDQPLGAQPDVPTLYLRSAPTTLQNINIGMPGYIPFTPGAIIPFGGPQNLLQLYSDHTLLLGAHDVRFGGSYVRIMDDRTFGAYQEPAMTLGSNVPNAMDNLMLGQALSFQGAVDPQGKYPGDTLTLPVGSPNFTRNNRYNEYALYFNDAWNIKRSITASLGLRYEYYGVQHNSDPSLDSNFYYGAGATIPEQIKNGSVQVAPQSLIGGLWKPDRNNFAPRLGIAWDVLGDGSMTVRSGYGIAYERNFGNVTFNVMQNPPAYAVVNIVSGVDVPSIPISDDVRGPLAGTGTKALPPVQLRNVDPNIRTAYAHLWNTSFTQHLRGSTTVSVDYTGSAGEDQYAILRQNIPGSGAHYLDAANPTARENPQYANLSTRTNAGKSRYNGLTIGVDNHALEQTGLSFTTRYTLGYAKDDLSSTFSQVGSHARNLGVLDPYNPDLDYGYADYDIRHRVALGAVWDLPLGRNGRGVVDQLIGGWQVTTLLTAQSGAPFSIYDCTNSITLCPRMMQVGALPTPQATPTGDPNSYVYLDLSSQASGVGSYADPKTGLSDFGPFPANMTARNVFRAPGRWNIDMAIGKQFHLGGSSVLSLRIEGYNVLAHANLNVNLADTDISGTLAVHAVRGYTGVAGVPGDGQRRGQVGIRFEF
jgi:outer membrane receptor protein involved in Fe transport